MPRRTAIGAVIVAALVGIIGAGLVAMDYAYWSVKPGMLAEDDFWDRCRSMAARVELAPGRYESVVWSETIAGVCQDTIGYCVVNEGSDGSFFSDAREEHQVQVVASNPSNCSYFGQLFAEQPPLTKVD